MNKIITAVCTIIAAFAAIAMPNKKELAKAQSLVEDITSADFKDLKAGKLTVKDVAKKHMDLARQAQNDAERYLLFQGAFKLYARDEDYDSAAGALNAMRDGVKDIPPEVFVELISKEMNRVAGSKAPKVLSIFKSAKRTVRCRKELAKITRSLKAKPNDVGLNKQHGECLAELGDWDGALKAFGKADGKVKQMADAEKAGGVPLKTIADFWWDYAEDQSEGDEKCFRIHAAELYRKAVLAGEVAGLAKVQADQRIEEAQEYRDVAFETTVEKEGLYCIIDLSAGPDAKSYPVTYMSKPPQGGFNTDEYKTKKLALRLVEPGTFIMCEKYKVTLTKPFYCGIFEVTQKQYELVMGKNPSQYKGDMRPVEMVSWIMLRGDSTKYNWPKVTKVDETSFIGRLQARTGLNFDLPTEAQWEYACRAGTVSNYNNGGETENDLKQLGRYKGNLSDGKGGCNRHTIVGSYKPNAWGLYDMHGNINERCLDWLGPLADAVKDPTGASSGSRRMLRGCGWMNSFRACASSNRPHDKPFDRSANNGFRLFRTVTGK